MQYSIEDYFNNDSLHILVLKHLLTAVSVFFFSGLCGEEWLSISFYLQNSLVPSFKMDLTLNYHAMMADDIR